MPNDVCILTTRDFSILQSMLERCLGRDDPMAALLKRKIDRAVVVFQQDVPPDVATLGSRVAFTVDGRDAHIRVISSQHVSSPVGLCLPITTMRGLALLGLAEGQEFVLIDRNGVEERILLERVLYQPESARRDKRAAQAEPAARAERGRPVLRVIEGARHDHPPRLLAESAGLDDPGPSAA